MEKHSLNGLMTSGLMRKLIVMVYAFAIAFFLNTTAEAQTYPAPQSLPASQDFLSLNPATIIAYPAGWQGWTIGTGASGTFRTTDPSADRAMAASGTAATTAGNIYNYLEKTGFLNSGSVDAAICFAINTTGKNNIQVQYDAMTIRNPYDGVTNTRINEFALQYKVGSALGSWTTLPTTAYQNITTPQTSGTTGQNISLRTVTLPSGCDNQPAVYLRWVGRDFSGGGARASFAIDNVSVTGTNIPLTITSFSPASACSGSGITVTINGTNLSSVTGVAFNGTTATFTIVNSGTIAAVLPAGATTGPITLTSPAVTLNSGSNFNVDTAPVINCPADVTTGTALNNCFAVVSFSATVNGSPAPGVLYSPASGSNFAIGTTNVTATATNVCGTASCNFNVIVQDNTPPAAVCQPVTVYLDNAGTGTVTAAQVNNGSSDACGISSLAVSPNTFSCTNLSGPSSASDLFFSEYVEGTGFNKYIEIYNGTGAPINLANYELRLFANGAASATTANALIGILNNGSTIVYRNTSATAYAGTSTVLTTVNWNGDDAIGLYKTTTGQYVDIFGRIGDDPGSAWTLSGNTTIDKTLRRVSTVTAGITTNPSGTGAGAFTTLSSEWTQLNVDDVSGLGSHSFTPPPSTTPVTLSVTDVNGNSSTCISQVTVLDTISPTVICQNITVSLNASGAASITASQIDNGSSDACGIATMTVTPNSFTCLNTGPNNVVLTVTDINGNSAACTAVVTVQDNTPPNALCQNIAVSLDATGNASITASQINNGSNDNCGIANLFVSPSSFNCSTLTGGSSLPSDLFISEYTEGSSNNKCIEIFNGTGSAVNLATGGYQLQFYFNGATSSSLTINLTGTLAPNDVYVVCQASAAASFLAQADQTNGSGWYNGDDAVVLSKNSGSTVLDIIGRIGEDPGTAWGTTPLTTADRTLRRKNTVTSGVNINPASGFPTLATEWDSYVIDDNANLGQHSIASGTGSTIVPVTLTVTDVNGNISTCVANVTVTDNTPPQAICQNITVALDANGTATISASQINNGSNDACGIASMTVSPNTFTCANIGANTVTLTVTDVNGNTSTCTATVTIQDNNAPVAQCQSITVQLNAAGTAFITASQINNGSSDNCSIANMTVNPSTFNCSDVAGDPATDLIISEYVEGSSSNKYIEIYNGTSAAINLSDYQLILYANGSTTATNTNTLSGTLASGATAVYKNSAATVYTGTATAISSINFNGDDAVGLFKISTGQYVDIFGRIGEDPGTAWGTSPQNTVDRTLRRKPTVLSGVTVNPSSGFPTLTSEWDFFNIDVVSGLGSHSLSNGNLVTFTVTDANGNSSSCTATVTVQDLIAPTAVCQPVTVQLNAAGTASVTAAQVNNGSSDNCGIATITVTPNTFTCANVGPNTVTLTVTDINGLSSTCTSTVTVQDLIAPSAVCQPVTVQLNAAGTASVTAAQVNNGSSDNCGIATMTVTPNTFTCANVGPNTVTLTVTDVNGLISTCTATVTVQDLIAPTAVCKNATVQLNAAGTASVTAAQVDNGSYDNCAIQSVTVSPNTFTCANVGPNTVTLTVTDVNGLSSTCTATVTVQDLIAPTAVCQPVTVQLNAAGAASVTATQVDNGSFDNCAIQSVTVSPNTFTCANVGPNTVTLTVTDVNGLISTCTATVTVQDLIAPTAVCQPVTVQLNAAGTASVSPTQVNNGSYDNCGIATMTVTPNTFTCANVGPNTVTLTVTDINGLSSTCTTTVTVQDLIAPTAVCQPVTVQLNAFGTASVTANQVNNGSFDNCGIQSINVSPNSFTCTNLGPNTVTFTVTDVNGLSSTCTSIVTVVDNIAPTISCPGNINVNSSPSTCGTVVTYTAPTGTDNCQSSTLQTAGLPSGSLFPVGSTVNTFTVTDAAGNQSSCSFTVNVTDIQAPDITNCPSNITSCNPVTWTPPTITDNCPGVVITSTHSPGSNFPVGNTTVTYTATDVYGNTSSCSFVVNRLPESAAADSITSNRLYNNICIGSNITLTLNGGSLGSGANWVWYSGTCGGTPAGTGTSITVSPTTTTTYFVRAEGSCNTTTCASITVVVSSGPPAQVSIISTPVSGAVGQSGTLTVSTPAGATYYQYTSNLGHISAVLFNGQLGPYTTSSNTVTLSFQQSLQNYQIRVIALNACGRSNTASAHIRGTVPAPGAITGTNIACPGQTTSYSIPAVTGSNNYVWTLTPSTAGTITGQGGLNITVNWSASFTTATLCVNGVTIFGLSGPQTCMTISNNAPAPAAVVGKTDPCPSSTETYTISPVSGAISYLWNTTVPGATISVAPGGLSASVTYPSGTFAGSICVSSSTSCGVSPATCLSVTNGAPGQPGPVTGPENGVCLVNGISYYLSTSDAVSYSWTSNSPNVNIASGNGTNSVLVDFLEGFTSGTLTVEAIYECGSSFSSINIDGSPGIPTVTPAVICPGSTEFYFASATGATSYTWNATGTLLDYCTNAGCSQYYVEWNYTSTLLSVTASNSCGTSAPFTGFGSCRIQGNYNMEIYPNPSQGLISLEFLSSTEEMFSIEITDMTGRAAKKSVLKVISGTSIHSIDLTDVPKGIYALTATDSKGNRISKRIAIE